MKKIIIAMAAFAALFTTVSCSKEIVTDNPEEPQKVIFSAKAGDLATRTALDANGDGSYGLIWTDGDKLNIGGREFTLCEGSGTPLAKFEGTEVPADGKYTVYYPINYENGTWTAPQKYISGNISGLPMKAEVTVKDGVVPALDFEVSEGILRLVVKGSDEVDVVRIVVDSRDLAAPVTLDCGAGVPLSSAGTTFHIALPQGNYSDASIKVVDTEGLSYIKRLKAGKTLKITRSTILDASISVERSKVLSGTFRVSDTKQVLFSSGNLYWDGDSFEIEGRQRSFAKEWNTSHVSHLYYCALANSSYIASGAYSKESDELYCRPGTILFTNKTGFTAAGETDAWYVLSAAEWNYLLENNGSAWMNFNGVKGLVVFCDGYDGPEAGLAYIPEGCLFLPAAGTRCDTAIGPDGSTGGPGTDITNAGRYGLYWACDSGTTYANIANYLYFSSSEARGASSRSFCGVAVRLVMDICGNGRIERFNISGNNYGDENWE